MSYATKTTVKWLPGALELFTDVQWWEKHHKQINKKSRTEAHKFVQEFQKIGEQCERATFHACMSARLPDLE